MAWFKFIMFFVWAAAMVLSIWAVEVARMFARRVKKEAQRRTRRNAEHSDEALPWPAMAVILPIKGVNQDTENNVRALLTQQCPGGYRLLLANLAALLKSASGRVIEWRHVRYTLHNRLETTVERPRA